MEELAITPDFWSGRRVLVTGHTGFKGSWLSLWLAELGATVVGYADGVPTQPSLYESANVERTLTALTGDVRDRAYLERAVRDHEPEVVFHLAAQPLVRDGYANPTKTFETNVIGTMNVLEAARRTDRARVIVVVTTDKVYGHVAGRAYRETDPLGGTDPYSSSKAAAELVTSAYRESFFAVGNLAAIASVRAGNVIGGGDWAPDRLIPDLVRAFASVAEVTIRYPGATRPWQHVLDPLHGYLTLAERLWDDRALAGAWNFGPDPGENEAVSAVVSRFAELWGEDLRIVAPTGAQPPEAPSLDLDAAKARNELGWHPRWNLERALRETVQWYREERDGGDMRAATIAQIQAFSSSEPRAAVT